MPQARLRPLRKRPAAGFFARTMFHEGLRELVVAVFERLAGDGEQGVFHLGQQAGSGRTHALATLFHAARSGEEPPESLLDTLMEAGMVEAPPCVVAGVDATRVAAAACASGTAPMPRLLLVDNADAWSQSDIDLVSRALTDDGQGAVVFAGWPSDEAAWKPPLGTELLAVVRARLFEPVPREEQAELAKRATELTEDGTRADRQRLIASWPIEPRVIDRAVAFERGLANVIAAVGKVVREAGDGPLVQVAPPKPKPKPKMVSAPEPRRPPAPKKARRARTATPAPTIGKQKLLAGLRRLIRPAGHGPFQRVVVLPSSPDAVPDEPRLSLVGLLPLGSAGIERALSAILESGPGAAPRRFRNSLLFVTVDEARFAPLAEELKRVIAAERTLTVKGSALGAARLKELRAALDEARKGLAAGLAGCWDTLVVPEESGLRRVELVEGAGLRERAWKTALSCGAVREALTPAEVFSVLDRRGWAVRDHLSLFDAQLVLAAAVGAPRLAGREVLEGALAAALAEGRAFAVASGYSHLNARYTDLRQPTVEDLIDDDDVLLVKHEVAARHLAG